MPNWRFPTALPILWHDQPDAGFGTMKVTSPFGWRDNPLASGKSWHNGLDIGNFRLGDEVVAAADGIVLAEGWLGPPWTDPAPIGAKWPGPNYGGIMVVIRHDAEWVSVYAHLARTTVDKNQPVKAGDIIGYVGETGSAHRAGHLHFEIERNGREVDPWPLITQPPGDDMAVTTADLRHIVNKRVPLTAGAHFRADATTASESLHVFPVGETFIPTIQVSGEVIGDRGDWWGGWMFAGTGWRFGFFHGSVLGTLEPINKVTDDAQVAELKSRIAAAKAALG